MTQNANKTTPKGTLIITHVKGDAELSQNICEEDIRKAA